MSIIFIKNSNSLLSHSHYCLNLVSVLIISTAKRKAKRAKGIVQLKSFPFENEEKEERLPSHIIP